MHPDSAECPGAAPAPSRSSPLALASDFAARVAHGLSERWFELRLGIRTGTRSLSVERRADGSLWKNYAPVGYRSFLAARRLLRVRPGEDVFVDYGAGKGRVLILAATLPFRRVLGVEVRPDLAAAARGNLRRAARRLRCPEVEILEASAEDLGVPDDATVLHFFDPFAGPILERLVDEIAASLERRPRGITILFADDHHFAGLLEARPWIQLVARVPWAYSPRIYARGRNPERCSYGIYRADSRRAKQSPDQVSSTAQIL
jgi:SAM-dependent methyltransferase